MKSKIRLWLALCVGAGLALAAVQAKEKGMEAYLYVHELDSALFPELEGEPGVYAVSVSLVKYGCDKRIPAPKGSAALLVSYRLLAADVPPGSTRRLEIAGKRSGGKSRRTVLALMVPPPKRDNFVHIEPRPSSELPEGTLDSAVFWVDLGRLISEKTLLPGDVLTLRYGKASASVTFRK